MSYQQGYPGPQPQYQYQAPMAPRSWPTGARIGAWLIDLVLYLALAGLTAAIFGHRTAYAGADACSNATRSGYFCNDSSFSYSAGPIPSLIGLLWFVGVFGLLQGVAGGSLGKLAVGLRVVKADGQICGIGRSLIRSLLWIVDAFPYCLPLVGIITGLAGKEKRRVGDLVAGTWVVRKAEVGIPPQGGVPFPAQYPAYPPGYGYTQPPPPPPPGGTWQTPPPPPPSWPPQG